MISVELINILIFLLPGFLAAAIFYWLTAHTKPSTFGQVVQALIFTFVVHILFSILFKEQIKLLEESSLELNRNLIWLILIAVCLGLLFAWISNKDLMHKFFRYIRITKENSYPSEWYSAFSRHPNCFVVLYMVGNRRLYGWPTEWPSKPGQGHFRIEEAEWLQDEQLDPIKVQGILLIPESEVEMVEFLPYEE